MCACTQLRAPACMLKGKHCVQIRLHAEPVNPAEPSNFVEVLDSMTNLGPIIDFVVVDLERQGQGQVLLQLLCAEGQRVQQQAHVLTGAHKLFLPWFLSGSNPFTR